MPHRDIVIAVPLLGQLNAEIFQCMIEQFLFHTIPCLPNV